MASVNRQLHAQLDEPVSARRERRSNIGIGWIEQLGTLGAGEARLARADDGAIFVIEGARRRPVRSGLLAAALEELLGPAIELTPAEIERLVESVPVEMFESSTGAPFVVIGGRRHGVRGVPLPYPVDNRHAAEFAEGPELNLAAANVARRKLEEATAPRYQFTRMRGSITSRGIVGTLSTATRRLGHRVKRAMSS
jgi:hypothetical protein